MGGEIRLNAFVMNCVVHQSPGLWRHPRDRGTAYTNLQHWIDLAQLLEEGLFDNIFIADVIGIYDVYEGAPDHALRGAVQVPANDPLLIVPTMAYATKHIGFGVTANLSYENPYLFARRFSTLDHLTQGRVGWNIVTGYLDSAARGAGKSRLAEHDARYTQADEFLQIVYGLWEQSWQADAVVRDKQRGLYADPHKVHAISYSGEHYRTDAIHLCEPSPQRTPVLFQAGTSKRGVDFAARHAECVFISGPSRDLLKERVRTIRDAAAQRGRAPGALKIFAMMTVIVARTAEEAQAKLKEYRAYADPEGALVLLSGWTGVDFAQWKPDDPVRHIDSNAGRTAMENVTRADPERIWTVREVAEHVSLGGIGPVVAGTPGVVADILEAWVDETGIDGFNLSYAIMPDTYEDVVRLLIPELQKRGRYKTRYTEGTLRHKLFGSGPALPARHPARSSERAPPIADDAA